MFVYFYFGTFGTFGTFRGILCCAWGARGAGGAGGGRQVWDATTGELLSTLRKFHQRGILAMDFSSDSTRLVSVGNDNRHSVAVWHSAGGHWDRDGQLQASATGSGSMCLFALFMPVRLGRVGRGKPNTANNAQLPAFPIVVGGVKHVQFVQLTGRQLRVKNGACSVKRVVVYK